MSDFILDDYTYVKDLDEIFANIGKPQKPLSDEEKRKNDLELKEMEENLQNYDWWAKKYPEKYGQLVKEMKAELAEQDKLKQNLDTII